MRILNITAGSMRKCAKCDLSEMQFFLKWLYDVCAEFRWQPEITAINYRALYTAND